MRVNKIDLVSACSCPWLQFSLSHSPCSFFISLSLSLSYFLSFYPCVYVSPFLSCRISIYLSISPADYPFIPLPLSFFVTHSIHLLFSRSCSFTPISLLRSPSSIFLSRVLPLSPCLSIFICRSYSLPLSPPSLQLISPYLFLCLSICFYFFFDIYIYIYIYIYMCVCVCVCVCVCLSLSLPALYLFLELTLTDTLCLLLNSKY